MPSKGRLNSSGASSKAKSFEEQLVEEFERCERNVVVYIATVMDVIERYGYIKGVMEQPRENCVQIEWECIKSEEYFQDEVEIPKIETPRAYMDYNAEELFSKNNRYSEQLDNDLDDKFGTTTTEGEEFTGEQELEILQQKFPLYRINTTPIIELKFSPNKETYSQKVKSQSSLPNTPRKKSSSPSSHLQRANSTPISSKEQTSNLPAMLLTGTTNGKIKRHQVMGGGFKIKVPEKQLTKQYGKLI